jgi:flagellar biosynthesis protein FlhB
VSDDQDQRTLPPSQKRIHEFRKRGEIALSRDLVAVATLGGGLVAGLLYADGSADALTDLVRLDLQILEGTGRHLMVARALGAFGAAVLPTAIGALAGCAVAIASQLGWPPALAGLRFDLTRPLSLGGIMSLVSPKAGAGRALKASAKVAFVGAAAFLALRAAYTALTGAPTPEPLELGHLIAGHVRGLFVDAGGALAVLAAADYLVQRRSLGKKMRMTPEEAKREHRESEGDPQIRRRRRQRMRELAKRRLTATVPTADVVLVNPTEYAVALRYRADEGGAPRVVAKGKGAVAEQIRAIARKAGIPIVAEPPLTRLIHKLVPEGREIPAQLFQAVAEVLAYVYRLRGRNR